MPTLALCVIAKNSAATLRMCLESVSGFVDEIVLVDTGSTDNTVGIARECGAHVFLHPWSDDFSVARNAALMAAGADWVLVLDADEELDSAARHWIKRELRAPRADGYVTPIRNYLPPGDEPLSGHTAIAPGERHPRAPHASTYVVSEICRLYRRDPEIYYIGQVHEQVEHRLLELGRPVARAGFFIHHFGWYLIDVEKLQCKTSLYRDLLAARLRETPDDPVVLMQYGDSLSKQRETLEQGLACFMKAAALKPDDAEVWAHMAAALIKMGRYDAALIAAEQMPGHGGMAGRRAQLRGEALGASRRWPEALAAYREVVAFYPDYVVAQAKLALIEMEMGEQARGMARMRQAIAQAEAEAVASRRASVFLRAAELHSQIRQWPEVRRLATAGLACEPLFPALYELLLKAAVAMDQLEAAAEAAAGIAAIRPSPGAALRHAAILARHENRAEACRALERGLALFPQSAELQQALCELHDEIARDPIQAFRVAADR